MSDRSFAPVDGVGVAASAQRRTPSPAQQPHQPTASPTLQPASVVAAVDSEEVEVEVVSEQQKIVALEAEVLALRLSVAGYQRGAKQREKDGWNRRQQKMRALGQGKGNNKGGVVTEEDPV